ncbi:MAG: peptidoglycan DD-metalloendopeptidase family protein [Candidatus Pseudobacter hemicellulosilyticus]|uniref:Peptidoglycan DD-metalloendopeptidase family protein n=1 Tax=Candidatus Pseudobacter hemicellulosilyticus TaxID=3121375 RepID=A0AAJ5WQF6_9BACT|nr:MAG: peptidoglycan DD-metalloendopeptidase family protein [Pseudobacter sp.]
MLKFLATLVLAVMCAGTVLAQGSDELKKKQAEIQDEIDELRRSLNDTKKNTKAGLGQLNMIKKKLRLREQAITNISDQIDVINGSIGQSRNEITRLRTELDTLKVQYEKSVVYAYKNRSNYDFLNFIFSASNFNDALRRIEYLKSYRRYREQQAVSIRNTQDLLQGKISTLENSRKEKDDVLAKQEKEKKVLDGERREKDDFVKNLKSRERELSKELTVKAKADLKLKSAIRAAIDREIKAARAKAEAEEKAKAKALADAREKARKADAAANKPATSTSPSNPVAAAPAKPVEKPAAAPVRKESVLEATPEGVAISGGFEKNRGKLPWPVEKCNIKIHFGTYGIDGTNLRGNNPGLTLETEVGAVVKAVYEGKVTQIFDLDGNWVVLVQHGKYFTTYSNLSAVSVSKNQEVVAGQMLGRAAANDDGNGEIDFLLLQENRNLDPETWIRRR